MLSTLLSIKKTGLLLSLLALAGCGQRVATPAADVALETRPVAAPLPAHRLAEKMGASIDSTEAALEAGWVNARPARLETTPDASLPVVPASQRPAPKPQPKQAVIRAGSPAAAGPAGA